MIRDKLQFSIGIEDEIPVEQGKFIVFEGMDGAGKTTTIEKIKAEYNDNPAVLFTREPGGTPFAEAVRSLFKSNVCADVSHTAMALIVNAARHDHVVKKIVPALSKGVTVISDRYADTTRTHQHDCPDKELIIDIGTAGLIPDITVCLDIDYFTYKKRILTNVEEGQFSREEIDHLDLVDEATFNKRRNILLGLVDNPKAGLHVIIDASGTPEETFNLVKKALVGYLPTI